MVARAYRVIAIIIIIALVGWVLSGCASKEDRLFGGVSGYMRCQNEGRC